GIHSLLGIELVDQLSADLTIFRRRLKKTNAAPADQQKITKLELELQLKRQFKLELTESLSKLHNDLAAAQSALRTATDKLERQGGDLFAQRSQLEKEKLEVASTIRQVEG